MDLRFDECGEVEFLSFRESDKLEGWTENKC